jgi:periplasmic divalent cation tolerance protein
MRIIYTTCSYAEEARSIVKTLIQEKIVACANYWDINSLYYTEAGFKETKETALILKLPAHQLDSVRKRLREMHSYAIPCIIVLKPDAVNNNYLQWLHGCCGTTDENVKI